MQSIYSLYNGIVGFRLVPKFHFEDGKGNPLAGGVLCTYIAGTNTPVETFKDEDGETKNPIEIKLDSKGECDNIFLDKSISYKFALYDAKLNQIWVKDNITFPGNQES